MTRSTFTTLPGRTIETPGAATITVAGNTYQLDAIETYDATDTREARVWVSYRTAKRSIRRPIRSTDKLAGVTA